MQIYYKKCYIKIELMKKIKDETDKLFAEWMEKAKKLAINSNSKEFSKSIYQMVDDFEKMNGSKEKKSQK